MRGSRRNSRCGANTGEVLFCRRQPWPAWPPRCWRPKPADRSSRPTPQKAASWPPQRRRASTFSNFGDGSFPAAATGVPTPAKRRPEPECRIPTVLEPPTLGGGPTAKASAQPSKAKADEPLRPIPDPMEGGPVSIEAASLEGVTPGVSTKENVEKAWGKPKKSAEQNGSLVQLYSVGPFKRVEVNYSGNRVASLVAWFRPGFSRRWHGQTARPGHGSTRPGLQRFGRNPRPILS